MKDWRKRSSPLYHAHKIVVFIKGSQARLESFKALTTNPEFAPAAVDRNEAIAFFDEAQAEPTAMDFAMAPPPRPTDPTEPQTGDISGLSVKMANDTRWNSDAAELDRLLKLRKAVDYYTQKRADAGEDIQPLSVQEWRVIESVRDLLQPFLYHTKLHEGNSAAIHDVFSSLWDLEQHLRVWLQRFGGKETHAEEEILDEITASSTEVIPTAAAASPSSSSQSSSRPRSRQRQQQEEAEESDTSTSRGTSWRQKQREAEYGFEGALFLQVSVQEALYLVAKYKRRLRSCPIYLAATILHPRYRTGGIRKAAPLLLDEAEQQFKNFLRKYWVSDKATTPPPQQSQPPQPVVANPQLSVMEKRRTAFMEPSPSPEPEAQQQPLTPEMEYKNYVAMRIPRQRDKAGREVPLNPLCWWRDHRTEFPILSQMAIDVLSVPAMSSECERVFSQGKLTITSQRHRMKGATLEMLLCLKDWLKKGTMAGPAAEMAVMTNPEELSYLPI